MPCQGCWYICTVFIQKVDPRRFVAPVQSTGYGANAVEPAFGNRPPDGCIYIFKSPRTAEEEHAEKACSSSGGPEEIRTPDPYNANVMRSQLRYGPMDYRDIIAPEQPLVKFFLPFFQKMWYDAE